MSEMGGVDAGPLYVDVVADLTGFSRGLQEQINARVSRIKATIKADIDQRKLDAQLAQIERKQHQITMGVAVDDAKANAQIAAFAAKKRQAEITVEVSEAKAEADLAAFAAKKRTVTINAAIEDARAEAELDKIAAKKRVTTIQADADVAMAEAKIAVAAAKKRKATIDVDADTSKVTQKLDSIGSKLQGIGTGAVGLLQFPAIAAGISMAAGALAQVAAGLFSVASAAAPAVGVLGAIPGLVAGAAQGIGSIVVGFMGIGKAVKASGAAETAAAATSTGASAQRAAAAQRIAAAQDRISQANASLANTEANAARQVSQAQAGVQRAHEEAAQGIVKAEQQVAEAHTQAARDIEAAERRVSAAQRDAVQAQQDLIRARADAVRQLQDMNNQNVDQGFSVEEAKIGVQRADIQRTKVNANPQSTNLDKQQADLDYREAVQRLKEQQLAQQRLAKDTAAANKAGVEGSSQVVQARQKVQDANQKLIEEEQSLRDTRIDASRKVQQADAELVRARIEGARKIADAEDTLANAQRASAFSVQSARHEVMLAERDLADAQASATVQTNKQSAANVQLAAAMKALSPAGRAFVDFLRGTLTPAWQRVQKAVQEALLPPVQRGLTALMPLLGILQTGMVRTAQIVGRAFDDLATKYLATPMFKRDMQTILGNNNRAFQTLATALTPLARMLTDITVAAGPMLQRFAEFIAHTTIMASNAIHTGRETGKLGDFFKKAADTAAQLGRIAWNLLSAVFNIGEAAAPAGKKLLDSFEGVTRKWKTWTGSMEGQNKLKDYFDKAVPTMEAVGRLIHDIVIDFFDLGNDDSLAGKIDQIRTQLLPPVKRIADNLKGAFGQALITAIGKVATAIADLTDGGGSGALTTFVQTIGDMADIIDRILKLPGVAPVAGALAGVAGAMAAISFILGPTIKGFGLLSGALDAIIIRAGLAAEGFTSIGFAVDLAMGPVGWVALGLTAVSIALYELYQHSTWFRNAVNRVWDDIKSAASSFWGWLQSIGNATRGLNDAVAGFFGGIVDKIKTAFQKAPEALATLGGALVDGLIFGIGRGIRGIGSWLNDHVLQPIIDAVKRFFGISSPSRVMASLGGDIVAGLVQGLLSSDPVTALRVVAGKIKTFFTNLGASIRDWWSRDVSPIWAHVRSGWDQTRDTIGRGVDRIKAFFTGLGSSIRDTWNRAISATWGALRNGWNNTRDTVSRGVNAIKGFFTSLGNSIRDWWNRNVAPVWAAVRSAWNQTRDNISAGVNRIKGFFSDLGTRISGVWNGPIKTAFNAIKSALGKVQDAFRTGVGKIKTFWDGLKNAVTAPVRFVIDTIYNNGIRGFWNAVAGKVGLPQLGQLKIKGINASRGTVVPGYAPGVDIVNAVLSPGEGVLVPEAVRGLARTMGMSAENAIQMINSSFSSRVTRPTGARKRRHADGGVQGFDIGGIFHGIGSGIGWVGNQIGTGAKAAAGFVGDKIGAAVNALKNAAAGLLSGPLHAAAGPIHDLINRVLPASPWFMGAMRKGGNKLIDDVIDKIVGKDEAMNAAPSVGGGANWQQLWSIVKGAFPGAQLFSSFRPGAITVSGNQSYHALGQAIDVTPSMAIFNWLASHYPKTAELIFSPAGGRQIKNGHPYYYTGAVRAEHFNHVHWALGGGGGGGGGGPSSGSSGGNAANKAIGKAMAAARGWVGGQWNALDRLWTGESGWNNRARNPSSGAFGIPQALPPGKMGAAAAGGDARAQIAWGLNYIKQVYGNPATAYARWLFRSPHWYSLGGLVQSGLGHAGRLAGGAANKAASLFDSGGVLHPGSTLVQNNTGQPEMVFTGPQWDTLSRIVTSASSSAVVHEPSASERMQGAQIDIHVNGSPGQDPREIAREVAVELGWLLR